MNCDTNLYSIVITATTENMKFTITAAAATATKQTIMENKVIRIRYEMLQDPTVFSYSY